MKNPHPSTILALAMSDYANTHAVDVVHRHNARIANDATRVVDCAKAFRKLNEHGCNYPLTDRQEKRRESLERRADELLRPYGLEMGHPWGLCMYAAPIGHDGSSQSNAIFLA